MRMNRISAEMDFSERITRTGISASVRSIVIKLVCEAKGHLIDMREQVNGSTEAAFKRGRVRYGARRKRTATAIRQIGAGAC
jgi:hypothetical protein